MEGGFFLGCFSVCGLREKEGRRGSRLDWRTVTRLLIALFRSTCYSHARVCVVFVNF